MVGLIRLGPWLSFKSISQLFHGSCKTIDDYMFPYLLVGYGNLVAQPM